MSQSVEGARATVTRAETRHFGRARADAVGTVHLLFAVIAVYGWVFDRELFGAEAPAPRS